MVMQAVDLGDLIKNLACLVLAIVYLKRQHSGFIFRVQLAFGRGDQKGDRAILLDGHGHEIVADFLRDRSR
jgi:hypothetical protein